ncbi:hypothetical protein [Paenibacillus sp. FSL K6-0108]|uniref:hypothetical protein n=1 Tax=Paenibacillus sp. FSL K6-0108 TaxID=2921417 RepID=UPI00386DD4D0
MDTVKGLRPEDVFVLHTPFKPAPLLGILKLKGYSHWRYETDYTIILRSEDIYLERMTKK